MTKSFDEYLAEQLKNPEVKKEYDAIQPDSDIIKAMIASGMTSQEISEKSGISRTYISRLENMNGNPSLRTLKRLAAGMGMQLHLSFTPINQPG